MTSMTENDAIYQNNEYISLEKKKMEPIQPVQMKIYQSNIYHCTKDEEILNGKLHSLCSAWKRLKLATFR